MQRTPPASASLLPATERSPSRLDWRICRSTTPRLKDLLHANATAVFQFESRGMRDLLKRAKPDRFEDIIALVALFRPGPMELIPDYIERKHGRSRVDYLDPRLETILGPTYGIMVYQEQVMQIAQVIGGYTLGGADLLRRAMGKKKPEEMATHRDIFVAGAERNGLSRGKAQPAVRLDGEVRRLRLQQVARGGLRAGRLPDRLHEGASSGRFHGRQPLGVDGRHRQGAPADRGQRSTTASRSCRRTSTLRDYRFVPVGRDGDPLWAGRHQGHRRIGHQGDRRSTPPGRAFPGPVRVLPARGQARHQPARAGGADPCRCVRQHRRPPRQPARLGR